MNYTATHHLWEIVTQINYFKTQNMCSIFYHVTYANSLSKAINLPLESETCN